MKKLIYLLMFLALATNTSCLKKQNLDDDQLGEPIAAESLTKAMTDGFGPLDYGAIKANEFSSYVLTQKIQDSYIETIEQQDLTIKTSTDTAESLSLDLILSKIKYSGGQSSQSTREWQHEFAKNSGDVSPTSFGGIKMLADNDPPTFLSIFYFQNLAFGSCQSDGDYPETCHQLVVTDFQFQVPATAAAQHNCSELEDCFINARRIEFDTVRTYQLDQDGKPKRTHYTIILSKEVPYLSRVLQFCSRSLYQMSSTNQKILADICYNVNNYAFGN